MSLLRKLKSVLGFDSSTADRETRVTVERERSGAGGVDESPAPADSPTAATGGDDGRVEGDAVSETPGGAASTDRGAEPVDSVKGIGPAYAERLEAAGIGTVDDLARADAERLAVETEISEKRLQGWIDRAAAGE